MLDDGHFGLHHVLMDNGQDYRWPLRNKTAYATRASPEVFAKLTKDMPPEEREYMRVENATNPLFDMWLRFTDVFADRAIDRLDISDADAEAAAQQMEAYFPAGAAFAYLLRQIRPRRILRKISPKARVIEAKDSSRKPQT